MILPLQTGYQNNVLRKKSLPVQKISGEILDFIQNMIETMEKNNGLGIAACQVGKNLRIFAIAKKLDKKQVFINPEIIKISQKKEIMEEGCLSLPGIYKKVLRPDSVKIKALDQKGKEFKVLAKGLKARVIQHELDHLNGILILDKHS